MVVLSQIIKEEDYTSFFNYFNGRNEDFIQQTEVGYKRKSGQISNSDLRRHFNKQLTLGVYNLTIENKGSFFCIDIDIPKDNLSNVDFENSTIKFDYLKDNILAIKNVLNKDFQIDDDCILYEDTGGRGFHAWVFLDDFIDADNLRNLESIIENKVDFHFEFFPKTTLNKKNKYGSAIKLPLGIHQKYNGTSNFINILPEVNYIDSLEDSFLHLSNIKKVPSEKIYEIIEENKTIIETTNSDKNKFNDKDNLINSRPYYYRDDYAITRMFNECQGIKQLHEEAKILKHDAIFNISNLLLSIQNFDIKNFLFSMFKESYNEKITQKNINAIIDFYPTSCKSLIRQGLCDGKCKKNKNDKNPLDKFLRKNIKTFKEEDLLTEIANENNILYSFYKLKRYNQEDSLFFDKSDFDEFEKDLDFNIKLISKTILQKEDIPLIGYEFVEIPKDLNDNGVIETRKLSFSFIFDQIVIQSFFNIIAQYFEEQFVDTSLGYRLDITKIKDSEYIFEDWKDKYPEFRDKILGGLRKENITHYLCCDIKGFYDNIDHDILKSQVKKYINDDYVIQFLEKVIDLYEFEHNTNKGLPQGPAYARILANLYLNDFDKEIIKDKNVEEYYRYVDDCFILLNNDECSNQFSTTIRNNLSDLGLSLSEKEEKHLTIKSSDNESIILDRIDSFKYGVFEEYKNITELDKGIVAEFYNAIKNNNEDILLGNKYSELNKSIPSFLYLISKKTKYNEEKDFKKLLLLDIKTLISKKQFFPKRLNKIFYWIIPHIKSELNCNIFDFYKSLVDIHKVYFVISLHDLFKRENKYEKALKEILIDAIDSVNPFLEGFATIISKEMDCLDVSKIVNKDFVQKIVQQENKFLIAKYLKSISFSELPNDAKEILFQNIQKHNYNNYLEYKLLFNNIESLDLIDYRRAQFLSEILEKDKYLFLVNAIQLFVLCKNDSAIFDNIQNYLVRLYNKKDVILDYIENALYNYFSEGDESSVQSTLAFYTEKLKDQSYKETLIEVLNNLVERKAIDTSKVNYETDEGCYIYENDDHFIERIPLNKIETLEDFQTSLPKINKNDVILDYSITIFKREIKIEYQKDSTFISLADLTFSAKNCSSIVSLLKIMLNVYKKAQIFYDEFQFIPKIDLKNILVRKSDYSIKFKYIYHSLVPRYTLQKLDGKLPDIITSNSENIAYCISIMMQKILYKTSDERKELLDRNTNVILFCTENILSSLAIRGKIKPIGLKSFEYLINEIAKRQNSQQELFNLYINIRIHSDLFRENSEQISARRMCKALESFYISSRNIIRKIGTKSIYYKRYSIRFKHFHEISKTLFQMQKNIESVFLFKNSSSESELVPLLELLTLYSIFNIETLSFLRIINQLGVNSINNISLVDLQNSDIESFIDKDDIACINLIIQKKLQGKDIFNEYINFTLTNLFLAYLLISNRCIIKDNKIVFSHIYDKNVIQNIHDIEKSLCEIISNTIENYDYEKLNINTIDVNSIITKINKHFIFVDLYIKNHGVKIKKLRFKKTIDKMHLGIFKKIEPSLLLNFPFIVDIIKNNKKTCASVNVYKRDIYNFTIENEHFNSFVYLLKGKFIGENRDSIINAFKKRIKYIYNGGTQKILDVLLIIIAVYFCYLVHIQYGNFGYLADFGVTYLIAKFLKVEVVDKKLFGF